MIIQVFYVEHYWKVIVYYNLDYSLFKYIEEDLLSVEASEELLDEVYSTLSLGKAKAMTYSNTKYNTSIVVFNRHSSIQDYINSLVHEAEHIKQAMLDNYMVKDEGEPPAYTIGYLVSMMWKTFKLLLKRR